jgi:hypothetical protein
MEIRPDERRIAAEESKRGPQRLQGTKGEKGDRGLTGKNGKDGRDAPTIKTKKWDINVAAFIAREIFRDLRQFQSFKGCALINGRFVFRRAGANVVEIISQCKSMLQTRFGTPAQPGDAREIRLTIVQYGDYAEGFHRFRTGGAETYYAQKYTVEYVASLAASLSSVTVVTCSVDLPPVQLPNGVRTVGVELYRKGQRSRHKELIEVVPEDNSNTFSRDATVHSTHYMGNQRKCDNPADVRRWFSCSRTKGKGEALAVS